MHFVYSCFFTWLLLDPETTYGLVVKMAREADEHFPVEKRALERRLAEAGLIFTQVETVDGKEVIRHEVRVRTGGTTRRVLKLYREAVFPSASPPSGNNGNADEGSGNG